MKKPLSNLDYLINPPEKPSSPPSPKTPSAANRAIEETAQALSGPILAALIKSPQGQQSAYKLVDMLNIRLEDLFAVSDVLANNFQWVTVDRSDPKGDYKIALTERGREYALKAASVKAL